MSVKKAIKNIYLNPFISLKTNKDNEKDNEFNLIKKKNLKKSFFKLLSKILQMIFVIKKYRYEDEKKLNKLPKSLINIQKNYIKDFKFEFNIDDFINDIYQFLEINYLFTLQMK